jgi:pimeloyl-ACP methyl ester carboxylesterase
MLAYDRRGSGEPLLLIHGISHRRQAWAPVLDQLAEHFDVIAIDLPGHGDSPAFELDGRSVRDALTDDIGELLATLGVERPHVVGNSLGALIAIELAEAGLARSVTAFAPAGFWAGPLDFLYVRGLFAGVQAAARALQPVAPRVLRSRLGRTLSFGWAVAHPGRIDAEAAIGDLANMVRSRDAIRTMFTGAYVYVYGGCGVPMTIAWGTRDLVLLPYHALRARRVLPHAVHRWLPSCGHIPMSDDPGLVIDTILEGARTVEEPAAQPA